MTEHNHNGDVRYSDLGIYVLVDSRFQPSPQDVRALAAELLEAAEVLERIAQPPSPVVLADHGQVAGIDGYNALNR